MGAAEAVDATALMSPAAASERRIVMDTLQQAQAPMENASSPLEWDQGALPLVRPASYAVFSASPRAPGRPRPLDGSWPGFPAGRPAGRRGSLGPHGALDGLAIRSFRGP